MIIVISNILCCFGVILCEIPFMSIGWIVALIICVLLCCPHFYLYCVFYKNSSIYLILKKEIIYFATNFALIATLRYILNIIYIELHIGDNYGVFLGILFWIIYNISKIIQLILYVFFNYLYGKK